MKKENLEIEKTIKEILQKYFDNKEIIRVVVSSGQAFFGYITKILKHDFFIMNDRDSRIAIVRYIDITRIRKMDGELEHGNQNGFSNPK